MKKAPFRVLVKINLLNPSHDVMSAKVGIFLETTKKSRISAALGLVGCRDYTNSIRLPNASAMRLNTSMLVA